MKEVTLNQSSEQSSEPEPNSLNYDCICIGTSILTSLETCYQASNGKDVLMVDKEATYGGSWKTIEIDGIKNIENAIHYFLPDDRGIRFMIQYLGLSVEVVNGKFRYFKIFNLGYIKISYSSWFGRLINNIFYSGSVRGFIPLVKYFFECVALIFKEKGERSYYLSGGSEEMVEKVKSILIEKKVQIWFNSKITGIYFDLENRTVRCQIGNKTVLAQNLILGHGARLPVIKSSNGDLEIKEKFYPRPAYHLIVRDRKILKSLEIVMASDSLIKYVHDVTRFTSLRRENEENKKVFVFALQPNVLDHKYLRDELFNKLKEIKVISSNATMIRGLYSDVILPTISDEDLYQLQGAFGDMVTILRTENFAKGMGYYADRWISAMSN